MRIRFSGGTGTISSACTQVASDRGIELHLLDALTERIIAGA
jgi:hypothetical protein